MWGNKKVYLSKQVVESLGQTLIDAEANRMRIKEKRKNNLPLNKPSTTMKQVLNPTGEVLVIHLYNNQLLVFTASQIAASLGYDFNVVDTSRIAAQSSEYDTICVYYKDKVVSIEKSKHFIAKKYHEVMNITSFNGIEPMIEYATISKLKKLTSRQYFYVGGLYGQNNVKVSVERDKILAYPGGIVGVEIDFKELAALIRTKDMKIGQWEVNENDIVKIGCMFVTYTQLKAIKEAYLKLQ